MYIYTSDEPAHVHLFSSSFPYYPPLKLVVTPQIRSHRIKEKNHVVAVASLRSRGRIDVQVGKNSNHGASRKKKRISPYLNRKETPPQKKKKETTLINLDRNHHLVFAADNSTSGPDDLAHCLCYKATSDGKIIPEDGATGSLCQQLHDGIPEQNFAGDPLYETYVSRPGTKLEEVHVRSISFFFLFFLFPLFSSTFASC